MIFFLILSYYFKYFSFSLFQKRN